MEIIERPVAASTKQKVFTTEPKTRRHKRHSISGNRARDFMLHLWREGWRESCHYKALKIKFIQYFETNDPRVYEKYLGRPSSIKRYSGSTVVRQNRNSGKIAYFMYSNQRTVEPKIGLMEVLGYITLHKKSGWVTLHHDVMSYYTKQATLDEVNITENGGSPPKPPLQEIDEESSQKASKQNLCVSHIDKHSSKGLISTESFSDRRMTGVSDSAKETSKEVGKKEEEVIDCTHKSGLLQVKPSIEKTETHVKNKDLEFLDSLKSAELLDSEPDRAKVKVVSNG